MRGSDSLYHSTGVDAPSPLTFHQSGLVHRAAVLRSLDMAIPVDLEAALAAEGLSDHQHEDYTNG